MPICGTQNPVDTSQDKEWGGSSDPPKGFFRLLEPLSFSTDNAHHDVRGEDRDKEDTLAYNSETLAGTNPRNGPWIGEFFGGGSR